ncbi:unnamed protein product [Hyaloperonospora brassicae]|uniref:Uncharacterized protein n=1 Tax=Hyaloperonospora brassicae TaxID=162125 RepID=A0AAV0UD87_HYABA|nr:unnamed protein product [Hyaloperonospora brassicae]
MSAKSSDVVDSMIDDSLLGILIILLVLMLSTGYVYLQQLRQGGAQQQQPPQRRGPATNASLSSRTVSTAAALASSSERALLSSTDFTDRQRRLHSQLPMRNGTRIVTISAAALFQTDTSHALSWTSDDVPALLSDLLHVADVYVLCKANDEKDTQHMLRVREWLTTHAALTNADTAGRGLQAHKILFCTTSTGKIAFVRQIEPHVHVDVDAAVVRDLEKHVPRIVHISTSSEDVVVPLIPNVIHVSDSFAGYFSLISSLERPK